MDNFITYFFYLIIYSFLGWICEVIYVAIITKKIGDRGFLYGPLVPIYGVGALLILASLYWLYDKWYFVLPLGFLITTTLEYVVSFVMEILFKKRWWDYSDKFLNINGRVCLRNSLMFTALVGIVIYVLHPYVVKNSVNILMENDILKYTIFVSIFIVFIVDIVFSTIKHVKLSTIITKFEQFYKFGSDELTKAKEYITNTKAYEKLQALANRFPTLKIKENGKRFSLTDLVGKVKEKVGLKK